MSTTIALLNAKGGVGKTTLALNLARYFTLQGRSVLLADADPQGSALAWATLADTTPFTVGRGISPGFDITLLDMPPRWPDKMPNADVFVLPTTLDGVSYVVFLRMLDRLRQDGKNVVPVVTRYNSQRAEHRERLKDNDLVDAFTITERASFSRAYASGLTVFDLATPHIAHSQRDIARLGDALLNATKETV